MTRYIRLPSICAMPQFRGWCKAKQLEYQHLKNFEKISPSAEKTMANLDQRLRDKLQSSWCQDITATSTLSLPPLASGVSLIVVKRLSKI